LSKGSILVVEKDPFYSSFYQKTLSGEGYRVYLAEGVEEGRRLFGERAYDVVISDIVLKGEDGLALLDDIRKASPRQDVVMITSMQSIRKAVEALKLGAADYLTKPVDADELLLLVRNLIERQNISEEHSRLVRENVLFFEQFRVQKRGLEVLGMLDGDRILDHFLDMAIEETGAIGAALWFFNEIDGTFSFAASRGEYDPDREKADRTFQSGVLRRQFFQGRALLEDQEGKQFPDAALSAIHCFRLPLLYGDRVTGMIALSPRRDDGPHGDYQVNVARVLTECGSIALQNARFFSLESSKDLRDPDIETYSPAYFNQVGLKEVNIARRYGRGLSIVCLEIDNFVNIKKRVKETQARRLLKEVAVHLLEVSRETDVLSMLDEGFFTLIVPETDYYGALMLVKRIKATLRNAVFTLDLKREVRLVGSCGAATYPGDGEQLITLLRRCRERILLDRGSLARSLRLEGRSFWKAYAHLVALGSRRDPALANCHLSLEEAEINHIRNLFLDEASQLGTRRGLMYIGSQTVDSSLFDYAGFSRLAGTRLSIFNLGSKGEGPWNRAEIMPVYLDDRDIREHRFLLCVADGFYYTLLAGKEGKKGWKVFHSADPYVTLEMVAKLQERYMLQQRIG
jgi:two-component system cell cycle response regulator